MFLPFFKTNSKNSSVPSVQEQLNHLLNGSTGEESRNSIGKGLSNGAFVSTVSGNIMQCIKYKIFPALKNTFK